MVLYQNGTCTKHGSPDQDYSAWFVANCESSIIQPWLNMKPVQDTLGAEAYKKDITGSEF